MTTTAAPPVRETKWEAFLEDVEWIVKSGEHPDVAATRLGSNRAAIARRMYRHGRKDLAVYFEPKPQPTPPRSGEGPNNA